MSATILKIGRRIAEVDEILRTHITDLGDARASALESKLDAFLTDTFGADTVEYDRYRDVVAHITLGIRMRE